MTIAEYAIKLRDVPETLTPTQKLAGYLLGEPLIEYVTEKRSQERPTWSWQDIAVQLSDDTDGEIDISGEILRKWYAPKDGVA